MSLSFNEIEAIALKAARGAGVSWGLAEEAAFAARWLAERGLDWSGALLARCAGPVGEDMTVDANRIRGTELCPLRVGAFIADAGLGPEGLDVRDVAVPLLLLPFLARAHASQPMQVRLADTARVWISAGGLHGRDGLAAMRAAASVMIDPGAPAPEATAVARISRPLPVELAVLQALGDFERRTYVPASAASRLAGAGAGLSDND